jgi:hypothetical protein
VKAFGEPDLTCGKHCRKLVSPTTAEEAKMSKVFYGYTRNGVVQEAGDQQVGEFSTPEEFREIIEREKGMAPNAAAVLDTWDGTEPLVHEIDSRARTVETWSVQP